MHENCISKVEGLGNMPELRVLNLSDNLILKVENLGNCAILDSLYLARNRIGRGGLDDLRGLLECPALTSIDLQNNHIDDPDILPEILCKLPNLKVLYLQQNPVCKKIPNYRKTIISAIPTLTYLDDRPVFKEDRRNAEAFSRGGIEEERKEREKIKEEERQRHDRNHKAFQEMMKKAREEKRKAEEAARRERGEPEPAEQELHEEEKWEKKLDGIAKEEASKTEKKDSIVINTWEENEQISKEADFAQGATVEEIKEHVEQIEAQIETQSNPVKEKEQSDDDDEPPELEQLT